MGGRIYEAAVSCQKLFSSCVSNNFHRDYFVHVRSAQGDFNLWCAAIKATSVGNASLDYSLRDHSDITDIVCKWLASLEASLQILELGTDKLGDDDVSENNTTASDSSSATGRPTSWHAISDDGNDSDSFTHYKAAESADFVTAECISYIRTALDRLAWLSLAIRKAGSKYRYGKIDEALDERAFAGFRTYLTQIILREVRELDAASLSTAQIMDSESDDRYNRLTAAQKQLILANILRRHRIEYTMKAFDKSTSKGEQEIDAHDDEPMVIRSSSVAGSAMSSSSKSRDERAMGSTTPSKVAITAPAATHTAASTAAGIESRFDVSRMLSVRASSAASNLTRVGDTQAYPGCPKPGQDRQLKCTYCRDVLPSSYSKSEEAWKAHVSQDLLPYTCFIEDCGTSFEMYLTSETLLAHLLEEHSSLRWICDFCALRNETTGQPGGRREFCGAEEWKQHMKEAHEDQIKTLQELQLAEMAELNKRPLIGPLSCPLCDFAEPNMSSKVDDHILQHLHEFSLLALPEFPQDGDADGSITSGATIRLSHTDNIKPAASETKYTLTWPVPKLNSFYDELIHLLPSSVNPRLQNFLGWVKTGDWASTQASQEFWATHFNKVQHFIRAYGAGVDRENIGITPALWEELVSQTFDELLTWQSERNSKWTSSSNSFKSQPTWRINLPPLDDYFVARNEARDAFIQSFLDELDVKLFMPRPGPQSFALGDTRARGDDKPEHDDHPGLRTRRQSNHGNLQPLVVLTGGQGVGKTSIAVELAHRVAGQRPEYSIFWVDATSATSIQESYKHIWKCIGEPQSPLSNTISALVYHMNWEIRGPWFMVLDGVHAHTLQQMVFKDWIPRGLFGTLLLTTRDASALSILGSAESVEMPPLPPLPRPPPSQPTMLPCTMWDKIARARTSTEYPYEVEFWPEGSLHEITRMDIILELYEYSANRAVNAVDNGLIQFILKHATKLFSACYISQIRFSSLKQTMYFFRNHSFSDGSLPFKQDDISQYADRLSWDKSQRASFLQWQWKFVAQRFSMDRPLVPVPLPTSTILPFVQASPLGQGTFGTVYKVVVHPSHFDRDDPIHQTNCKVAIKEVILKGRTYENFQFGQDALAARETRAPLHVLSLKDKDPECVKHIVDVKAIFDQGRKRYYMFPWADGGHLWNLWERGRVIQPQGEGRFVADIVAQILGLAEALEVLHQANCRHGDLKPDNILIFKRQNQSDMWKISDFGLAKFHLDSTQRRRGPTSTRHGTFSYEPPEFLQDHQPTSQLYDIWSMGCIILQLITWILYDFQGIVELTERTRNRYQSESTFWSQRSILGVWSRQVVHKKVKSHMKQILKDAIGSQAIKDLLVVVKDKLLVIQLPSDIKKEWRPGYRANAETLHGELVKISKRGESDPRYWFSNGALFRRPGNAKSSATASLH